MSYLGSNSLRRSPRETMWRFTPVRRCSISNGILYSGIALQATALLKQAYDINGRTSDIGWIGLAEFLPIALLVLVTGSVADHFNRKAIALVRGRRRGVHVGGADGRTRMTNPTSVTPLFAIAFAFGIARAFQAPAMRAMPPMVAPDGALPKMIALYSATWTGAIIVGPAIGGFLYAVDPWVAYLGSTVLIFSRLVGAVDADLRPRAAAARPRRTARPCAAPSRGCCSSAARPSCWPRSRSICSPCCSVAPWRCSR